MCKSLETISLKVAVVLETAGYTQGILCCKITFHVLHEPETNLQKLFYEFKEDMQILIVGTIYLEEETLIFLLTLMNLQINKNAQADSNFFKFSHFPLFCFFCQNALISLHNSYFFSFLSEFVTGPAEIFSSQ
jgi:hypothetical protein